ncbi:MAG: hypothetical protein P1U32_06155 [Legionellaceae bacterium]|nr:hypothetical protein [Legionellaceae bacterium]
MGLGSVDLSPAVEAVTTEASPVTNAAIFSMNWTEKTRTVQQQGEAVEVQGGNYQLSLPFSDYTRNGKAIKPDNHFLLNSAFHFGMPLLSDDAEGQLPGNIDEAKQRHVPFSISFAPVANNQKLSAENSKWLSDTENVPQMLGAAHNEGAVRLYQPITLKRDNEIIATMDSLVLEKTHMQQGSNMNIAVEGVYSPLKTKQNNGNALPGHFLFELRNLDASLVHTLEKEVNELKHLSPNKQMLLQLKMLSQLKALCKKGTTMTVSYEANTINGPVKQHYTVDLSELSAAPTPLATMSMGEMLSQL